MDNLNPTIVTVMLPSGQVVDIVNWSDKPVYSSADLQSGFVTEEIDLFQYVAGREVTSYGNPAGAPVVKRTATDTDTNVQVQGEMTTAEELLVYAIKPEFFMFTTPIINDFSSRSIYAEGGAVEPAVPASACFMPLPTNESLAILQQQLILRLKISEKVYAEAGLGYFNTGFGVYGAANSRGNAGMPTQEAVRSYTLPHHIGAQEKYRVQLINAGGNACNFGNIAVESGTTCDVVVRDDVMMTIRINLDGLYKRPTA
jgi:hypothetical protein